MATAVRYFDLVREMKDAYNHRLRLVENAKKRGIKPTARLFATTVPTVRKWLRRFEQRGPSGLVTLSRARHHQAQKTPPTTEAQLVELRKTLHTFGSRRLIREFDLPISHRALDRIWREHGLLKKRQKKYQRKQDLAHIKAQWALFQQISADTKDLDDIPRYWHKRSACTYRSSSTPPGKSAAACCSGPSRKLVALQPARCSPHASSDIWIVTASRCAIWSGRPIMAPSSRVTSRQLSVIASTCASRRPRTLIRVMSKPCIVSKK